MLKFRREVRNHLNLAKAQLQPGALSGIAWTDILSPKPLGLEFTEMWRLILNPYWMIEIGYVSWSLTVLSWVKHKVGQRCYRKVPLASHTHTDTWTLESNLKTKWRRKMCQRGIKHKAAQLALYLTRVEENIAMKYFLSLQLSFAGTTTSRAPWAPPWISGPPFWKLGSPRSKIFPLAMF